MRLAEKHKFEGKHIRAVRAIAAVLWSLKRVPMNIEAAGGAILLDLGFDSAVAHLIIFVGRGPMYAAAYMERLAERKPPFPKIEVSDVEDA
jgi:hypothetical protein